MSKQTLYQSPDCRFLVCSRCEGVLCASLGGAESSFNDYPLEIGEIE